MAMSDTGSSLANWSDDLYRYAPSSPGLSLSAMDGGMADSTIVASAAATPKSPASAGSGDGSPNRAAGGILGPRAAGKPAAGRKRARASRRAPVTMLNTDAANFRAMVQQFTGIPAPPAGPVINFGVPGYGFHQPPQPGATSVPFDHLQQRQQQPASAVQVQQQQQQYTGASFGYGNSLQQALAGGVFGSAEDRMLLQSMQAAQMTGAHTANSGANGYFA